jgi:hypothetical protein
VHFAKSKPDPKGCIIYPYLFNFLEKTKLQGWGTDQSFPGGGGFGRK